jgi:hypothetical protein
VLLFWLKNVNTTHRTRLRVRLHVEIVTLVVVLYIKIVFSNFEMNNLPVQVLENILSHIPVIDLHKSCVLVCQNWREIICRKKVG